MLVWWGSVAAEFLLVRGLGGGACIPDRHNQTQHAHYFSTHTESHIRMHLLVPIAPGMYFGCVLCPSMRFLPVQLWNLITTTPKSTELFTLRLTGALRGS